MSQAGVSILLRAGNNKQAAQQFLQQLIKVNTLHPIEVVILFNAPQEKHLQLMRDFAGMLSLVVRPAKERTFANVVAQLRYDQVLILTTPIDWQADTLPNAVQQLRSSQQACLELDAPKQTLLVKHSAMSTVAEHLLTVAPNTLKQAFVGKFAARQAPAKLAKPPAANKTTTKPVSTSPVAHDHAQLDQQISVLEAELEQLDASLSAQYQEIERQDIQCEKMPEDSEEAQALKRELKERVFKANDTLKTLKSQHDELERLRIRRYSILA